MHLFDVFHNVLAMIKDDRALSGIYAGILRIARRLECEEIIVGYFEHAKVRGN